jgi:hypothetical protein
MTEETTRLVISVLVVTCFVAVVLVVLLGVVDVTDPTIAKLVGAVFGYVTAILNPIIYRYFGGTHGQPGNRSEPPQPDA